MKYENVLKSCVLFSGIEDIGSALRYLKARQKEFRRGEYVLRIGDELRNAGLVLEGEIECWYQDVEYNKYNMNHFVAGEIFGESIACGKVEESPMQIKAERDCEIMFLDLGVLCGDGSEYEDHVKLAGNFVRMLVAKNLFLNQKVRLLSMKDLRGRIWGYLKTLRVSEDGRVTVPFTKTAMAEFLCVNRSAMSRELRRMEAEGLIAMEGRKIELRRR